MLFGDRHEAGRRLARCLEEYRGGDAVVLALPRGGVVVGAEIAGALGLPLDVIISRKIGAPGNPEYAIGAVAENGEAQLNEAEIAAFGIPQRYIQGQVQQELQEIERRIQFYRAGHRLPDLEGRTVILVDDGIATGFTVMAAIKAVRAQRPRGVVLAVPVAPPESVEELQPQVDKLVCLATPVPFLAVGRFYRRFEQLSDEEVSQYLAASRQRSAH